MIPPRTISAPPSPTALFRRLQGFPEFVVAVGPMVAVSNTSRIAERSHRFDVIGGQGRHLAPGRGQRLEHCGRFVLISGVADRGTTQAVAQPSHCALILAVADLPAGRQLAQRHL